MVNDQVVLALLIAVVIVLGLIAWRTPVMMERAIRRKVDGLRALGLYPQPGKASDEDVRRLVRAGQQVLAVRLYREVHGSTLAEAKRAVEGMAERARGA